MIAYNFMYDNITLQDMGFMLCKFDGNNGIETTDGAEISFNTVSTNHGLKHELVSTSYDDCLSFTLQICRNICDYGDDMYIDIETERDIMRWLHRQQFCKFKLIDVNGELSNIFFMVSFNISKMKLDGKTIGFQLEAITNSPFAFNEPITINFDIDADNPKSFFSKSDSAGYIYPDSMEITIKGSGDLIIANSMEDREMIIRNCVDGEKIIMNYPMIESVENVHKKIQNDFNFIFFRIATTFRNKENIVTSSLPCSVSFSYSPIVKVGI